MNWNKYSNKQVVWRVILFLTLLWVLFLISLFISCDEHEEKVYVPQEQQEQVEKEQKQCKHIFFNKYCRYCKEYKRNHGYWKK